MNASGRIFAFYLAVFGLAGCGPSDTSIKLIWPSAGAKEATQQLAVYAFRRDEAAVSGLAQTCAEHLAKLPEGEAIGIDPVETPFDAPFAGKQITNFPAGDPIILVVGFRGTTQEDRKPIVQGCSETYGRDAGTDDVPIDLQVIVPRRSTLVKLGGDRQVGRPGMDLPAPLRVRTDAVLPGDVQEVYALPGVELTVTPEQPDVGVNGAAPGQEIKMFTDGAGLAEVLVAMPATSGTRTIKIVAPSLAAACQKDVTDQRELQACDTAAQKTFTVSTVENSGLIADRTIATGRLFDVPIALGLGDVNGAGGTDAVILGCEGSAQGCATGRFAAGPLGRTRLALVSELASGANVTLPSNAIDLGITPSGLFVGPLITGGGDDAAVLNSRRRCTGGNGCNEGSEILLLSSEGGTFSNARRYPLTATNAVGLYGFKNNTASPLVDRLVTAGQGRSTPGRPCKQAPPCLPDRIFRCPSGRADCSQFCLANPNDNDCFDECSLSPENCGCAPNERCECPAGQSCQTQNTPGICVPQDKDLDILVNSNGQLESFENFNQCHRPQLTCVKSGGGDPVSSCMCLDRPGDTDFCDAQDSCGCLLPPRSTIGGQAGVVAYDFGLKKLRTATVVDIIAGSEGGIEFIPLTSEGFAWKVRKTPTTPIHGVRMLELDNDTVVDVIWYSKEACKNFTGIEEQCPSARRVDAAGKLDGQDVRGCMGVYFRENKDRERIDQIKEDGCRRHALAFSPDGICTGDFNGDGADDVALSSLAASELFVYLGDGQGGLLDPPEAITLPANGRAGPLACADIDRDNRADVVGLGMTGDLVLLRTGL